MRRRIAFTLVELLVVIGIIALLISILLPVLGKVRRQANLAACMAQLHDIGNAISMYTIDHKGTYPGPCLGQVRVAYGTGGVTIADYLWRYLRLTPPDPNSNKLSVAKVFLCPGFRAANPGTYDENNVATYAMQFLRPVPVVRISTGLCRHDVDCRHPALLSDPDERGGIHQGCRRSNAWNKRP